MLKGETRNVYHGVCVISQLDQLQRDTSSRVENVALLVASRNDEPSNALSWDCEQMGEGGAQVLLLEGVTTCQQLPWVLAS